MTFPAETDRYLIRDSRGQFLIDLWNGQPRWSCAAQEAVIAGHSWLTFDQAKRKWKEASDALGIPLSLAVVHFVRVDHMWLPTTQVSA